MNNTDRIALIKEQLETALSPSFLEIIDESNQHQGHSGAQSGLGHFAIVISSAKFDDKPRIECHRLIYQSLNQLMNTEIHALRIKIIH